jgi:hypothetical protein
MNNCSGHYLPGISHANNYLNIFENLGVDISRVRLQIYNADGQIVKQILPR